MSADPLWAALSHQPLSQFPAGVLSGVTDPYNGNQLILTMNPTTGSIDRTEERTIELIPKFSRMCSQTRKMVLFAHDLVKYKLRRYVFEYPVFKKASPCTCAECSSAEKFDEIIGMNGRAIGDTHGFKDINNKPLILLSFDWHPCQGEGSAEWFVNSDGVIGSYKKTPAGHQLVRIAGGLRTLPIRYDNGTPVWDSSYQLHQQAYCKHMQTEIFYCSRDTSCELEQLVFNKKTRQFELVRCEKCNKAQYLEDAPPYMVYPLDSGKYVRISRENQGMLSWNIGEVREGGHTVWEGFAKHVLDCRDASSQEMKTRLHYDRSLKPTAIRSSDGVQRRLMCIEHNPSEDIYWMLSPNDEIQPFTVVDRAQGPSLSMINAKKLHALREQERFFYGYWGQPQPQPESFALDFCTHCNRKLYEEFRMYQHQQYVAYNNAHQQARQHPGPSQLPCVFINPAPIHPYAYRMVHGSLERQQEALNNGEWPPGNPWYQGPPRPSGAPGQPESLGSQRPAVPSGPPATQASYGSQGPPGLSAPPQPSQGFLLYTGPPGITFHPQQRPIKEVQKPSAMRKVQVSQVPNGNQNQQGPSDAPKSQESLSQKPIGEHLKEAPRNPSPKMLWMGGTKEVVEAARGREEAETTKRTELNETAKEDIERYCEKLEAAEEREVQEATKKEWARDKEHALFSRATLDREVFDSVKGKWQEMKEEIVKKHEEQLKAGVIVKEAESEEKQMTAQEFLKQVAEQRAKCSVEEKKLAPLSRAEVREFLERIGIQKKPEGMGATNVPSFVCRSYEDLLRLEILMKEREKKKKEKSESESTLETEALMYFEKILDEVPLPSDQDTSSSNKEALEGLFEDLVEEEDFAEADSKVSFLESLTQRQKNRMETDVKSDENNEFYKSIANQMDAFLKTLHTGETLPKGHLFGEDYESQPRAESAELLELSEDSDEDSEDDDIPEMDGQNVEASTKWLMDQLAKLNAQAAEMKQMLRNIPGPSAPEESPEETHDDDEVSASDSEDLEYQNHGDNIDGSLSDADDDLEDLNDGNLGGLKTLQESLQKRQI